VRLRPLIVGVWLVTATSNPASAQKATSPQATGAVTRTVLPSEVIYLTDHGIFPSRIEHVTGKFFLVVVNRTSTESLNLLMTDSHGNAAADANPGVNRNHNFWLNLTPGTYTVTEATNSNLQFTLTVK
jgi:hypothetical protein